MAGGAAAAAAATGPPRRIADESELLDWLRNFATAARKPRRVFIVHGDPEASAALEPKVTAMGLGAQRPAFREEVEL